MACRSHEWQDSPLNSPCQQNRSHVCASFGLISRKGQNMSSIIDHVTLGVSDLETARHFYDRVMLDVGLPASLPQAALHRLRPRRGRRFRAAVRHRLQLA